MCTSGCQFRGGNKCSAVPVEIKSMASAMEQPGEKLAAGAEGCGEVRGEPQAAGESIEDRIRLLLRYPTRHPALALEAEGSNSDSLADS